MHFNSAYSQECYLCKRRKGLQPGGRGYVVLVRKKVTGKEVHVCKACTVIKRSIIK